MKIPIMSFEFDGLHADYRTSTVIALCETMRADNDYSAMPILADALEDAGYQNGSFLAASRDPALNFFEAQRAVALILDPFQAPAAASSADAMCEELCLSYAQLMEATKKYIETEEELRVGHGFWPTDQQVAGFWGAWEVLTGGKWPNHDDDFFYCSC